MEQTKKDTCKFTTRGLVAFYHDHCEDSDMSFVASEIEIDLTHLFSEGTKNN